MAEKVTLGRNLYLSYLYPKEKGLINQQLTKQRRSRKKQYAKKAIKNVFGSEVAMFESMAKKAKEGSYNHMKLLTDMMYEEDKDNTGTTVKAPIINFIGDSELSKKVKDKIIDVTPKDE